MTTLVDVCLLQNTIPEYSENDTSRVKIPSHLFYINLTALVTQKFQKNDKTAKTMSELGHSSYLLSE